MIASRLSMHPVDIAIIILYFIGIVVLGCWAGCKKKQGTGESGYFLAGRTLIWPVIGLSLFSTNISTVHLVSLAQEGYVNGLAYGSFEWMAIVPLLALSLFFAPFYIRANIATLPDFLEKRYSRQCRDWLAIISIISAIFIHIGFSLYTGAVVLRGMFGVNIIFSIVVIAIVTGLYTAIGGLLAVVLTESIQTIILLVGAICITAISYYHVGGWSGLSQSVEPVKLTLLRSSSDPAQLPWYSVFLGYPVIGLWYWCADQTIVQRVLGAKDENHARLGPLFAGFIKILPVFIFVLPGLICLALIRQGKLPNTLTDSGDTYAFMVNNLLPVGLKGLVAAALLAALMSTVSGALNSIATLFSYDILKRYHPNVSDKTMIMSGRIVTVIAMIAAIIWSPFVSHYNSIFQGITAIICYIAPPISAVFILGVFWSRASASAALATLWSGSFLGIVVFILDWFKNSTHWSIPPMMSAFYLFVICLILMIVVSLCSREQQKKGNDILVWRNPLEAFKSDKKFSIFDYRIVAALLIAIFVGLYIVFK